MKKLRVFDETCVPSSGVLKFTEVEPLQRSADIISKTESWSSEFKEQFRRELEQEKEEAIQRAYDDGLKMFVEARKIYLEAADQLSLQLEDLLSVCLKRVLQRMPSKRVIKAVLEPVMNDLRRETSVSLMVDPSNSSVVREVLKEFGADLNIFDVVEDPSLETGECRIFTEAAVITLGIPLTVDRLMTSMQKHLSVQRTDRSQKELPEDAVQD